MVHCFGHFGGPGYSPHVDPNSRALTLRTSTKKDPNSQKQPCLWRAQMPKIPWSLDLGHSRIRCSRLGPKCFRSASPRRSQKPRLGGTCRIYTHVHIYLSIYLSIHVYVHRLIRIYIYMYIRIYVCVFSFDYIYIYIHMHVLASNIHRKHV